MSRARSDNRRCPNCTHFFVNHEREQNTNRTPCRVPNCKCVSIDRPGLFDISRDIDREILGPAFVGEEPMKEPAHVAYDAYAAFTGGKTFDGRDMPKWDELPDRIKDAWRAAIKAVMETVDPC